jgi:hypothetical protein
VVAGPLAGRWTTCELPVGFNPVHASVLADGSVLLMAGSGNDPAELAAGRFQRYLFAPDTCAATRLPTPGDLFCSGHAMLPNGNILIAGGTKQYDPFNGLRTSYEYDSTAQARSTPSQRSTTTAVAAGARRVIG